MKHRDWKTMALKLQDAVAGLLRNPGGIAEQEWAWKIAAKCERWVAEDRNEERAMREGGIACTGSPSEGNTDG